MQIAANGIPLGDYPLLLQSFDNNSEAKLTLKEDKVIVTVVSKSEACPITEEAAQAMQDSLDNNPLEFEATVLKASYQKKSFELALQSLNVTEACGEIKI